jgi:hypothetical protein
MWPPLLTVSAISGPISLCGWRISLLRRLFTPHYLRSGSLSRNEFLALYLKIVTSRVETKPGVGAVTEFT